MVSLENSNDLTLSLTPNIAFWFLPYNSTGICASLLPFGYTAMLPFKWIINVSMLLWIYMDVMDMILHIILITNDMIPKSLLPELYIVIYIEHRLVVMGEIGFQ